ncbi:MAG: nucleotide sugar dehydrogenase, partial [Planctomycetota bacterium]
MSRNLLGLIESRQAQVAVVGCGYVGLPLALTLWRAGFRVLAVDIDRQKVAALRACRPYVWGVEEPELKQALDSGDFVPTEYADEAAKSDVVLLCLPTPLDENNIPDLSALRETAEWLAQHLRRGQLVVLESTTYPGTTEEVLRPILERSGLVAGRDFYLAYAPHRYDPGSEGRRIGDIPRVVGEGGEASLEVAAAFYETFTPQVVRVSNTQTAEAVKMLENIFRAVNIALVNELKEVFLKLGVDTYEAIEAAATKPFGFMKFLPGPGFGGHCVPVDPFYVAWRAKQVGVECDFV